MDERVWMGVDHGSFGEGWLWWMGWVREGLSGFVERVDQVKGEELVVAEGGRERMGSRGAEFVLTGGQDEDFRRNGFQVRSSTKNNKGFLIGIQD